MDEAGAMTRLERIREDHEVIDRLVDRERAAFESRRERLSLEESHGEEWSSVGKDAELFERDDGGMLDSGEMLGLLAEAIDLALGADVLRAQNLQRYASRVRAERFVDEATSAHAE
jgi:hypothetical protein